MLTAARAREVFVYNYETGQLFRDGKPADRKGPSGYSRVSIDYKRFLSHLVVWLLVYGVWPEKQIDHADLCKTNNRIGNLREATVAQNGANSRARRHNRLGIKGVRLTPRGRFQAYMTIQRQQVYLGTFDTAAEANAIYAAAARGQYGEFARND